MRLIVHEVGKGFYPQEILVEIKSTNGGKKMLIDERSIENKTYVRVGTPIANDHDGNLLVELPRETTVGEWRVWVPRDQVLSTG